jgi:hypothetical protein
MIEHFQSVLMRSSQPMTGPSSKRCKEDERLINSVLGPGKRGYIIDTRTQTLAQTAKVCSNPNVKDEDINLLLPAQIPNTIFNVVPPGQHLAQQRYATLLACLLFFP